MRITEIKFKQLYQEQKESGLSVREFCYNQGLAPATFYRWKKILREKESAHEFVPLVIGSPQPNNKHQTQFPNLHETKTSKDVSLEFIFPNGTKLLLEGNPDITLLKTIAHLY